MKTNLRTVVALLIFACAPGLAEEPALRPASMPWDMAVLREPPKFEWVDAKSPVRSLIYEGPAHKGHAKTQVFAYYATPGTLAGDTSKDKNLPAVVLIHGGGGTAFAEWCAMWAKRGYAAIAMDLAGSRPVEGKNPHQKTNRTRLPRGGPGQGGDDKFHTIDQPKSAHWSYHAVANCVRAHSLIRSFPETDADRTAVTGISWGGYLTCIVASIDDRFKAAVPVYGCGYLHHNSAWLKIFKQLGPEKTSKWVDAYDPSVYLPVCRVPIYFVNGTNDNAYPLDSYQKSFAVVRGEVHIRIEANMKHSHPEGWKPREIGDFVDWKLRGGDPLPQVVWIGPRIVSGSTFPTGVAYGGKHAIKRFQLVYTTDDNPINKHKWTIKDVEFKRDRKGDPRGKWTTQAMPPDDAKLWFFYVTDERGTSASTIPTPIITLPKVEKK